MFEKRCASNADMKSLSASPPVSHCLESNNSCGFEAVKTQDCLVLLQRPSTPSCRGCRDSIHDDVLTPTWGCGSHQAERYTGLCPPLLPRSATWCYSQNIPRADVGETHRMASHPPHSPLPPRANQVEKGPGTASCRRQKAVVLHKGTGGS